MSGLFDKRADGATRRDARTQKEQLKKRKSRVRIIAVLTAVALLFVCALFINSNFIRRTLPAITIDGVSFTAAEFDYFYNVAYFDYSELINSQFAEMPEFAASMLPARDRPFARQIYDYETGETWADFFVGWAIRSMSDLVSLYNASIAAGFVLEGEHRERFESELANVLLEADIYSSMNPHVYPTPAIYLQALFGSSINDNTLRGVLEFVYTAMSFSERMRDSFDYNEAALEAFYSENRDDLDIFRYRAFLVLPETLDRLDFDTTTEFQVAQEAALSDTREAAKEIAGGIVTEEDFIFAAWEQDEASYGDHDSTLREQMGEWIDQSFALWLCDESRGHGDVSTIESSAGTYVTFFIDRDNNDYYTTAMRQILMMREDIYPEDYYEGEEDPDFIEALENADREVRERAESVLELFISGGATEETLIELMEEFSDDTSSGGFYDSIARFHYLSQEERYLAMRVVPEIENWLFDEKRVVGDSELVLTEAFGYHLLYFMGYGERFRDIISDDRMRSRDFKEWKDGLPEVAFSKHWVFALTQH